MQIIVDSTPVTIFDNEIALVAQTAAEIAALPANSTIAIWPGNVGRQILKQLAATSTTPLKIYTLGQVRSINLNAYLALPSPFQLVSKPPKIDLAVLTARPATLDAGLISPSARQVKQSQQQIMEDLGIMGSEQQETTQYQSETVQGDLFEIVTQEELVSTSTRIIAVFKGDLSKDSAAACIEAKVGVVGEILRVKGEAFCDILSIQNLTQIMHPDDESRRTLKRNCVQNAQQSGERIAQGDVLTDLKSRVYTPQQQLFEGKKVLFFSPHPDDDVISAGGVVLNLCNHAKEFHVAYCVTGSVACPDLFVQDKIDQFSVKINNEKVKYEDLQSSFNGKDYLSHEKLTKDEAQKLFSSGVNPETKAICREIEAMSGVEKAGFFKNPLNKTHFMRLPFYGTGFGKRTVPGEKDIQVCLNLIQSIKPDVIFLAGDLSDPHGTHGHCYDVIKLALISYEGQIEIKDLDSYYSVYNPKVKDNATIKSFQNNGGIVKYLYRGAWAEFNIEDATFYIALTQAELDLKLECVRNHRSQMGQALYLGDDFRAFDVRAKERNEATASALRLLGVLEDGQVGAECYVGCIEMP
ncbi:Glucosamine-6-phosphate isomerase [Spironucleus salmonicida]|uniref:N-acetylglucosaminylphosphatidylinositol deacetylase n=2 Tax=Spironucleus salmonicida TaxID=348837 RepID=V6LYX9_9EUKA|nr:Glucosamine-6-phosphate isomerase [Spironucleus salmonicida]|eukprot:EST48941.1 Glucosamine-6-phosphate isomerase [Spironucleus salmonicida]